MRVIAVKTLRLFWEKHNDAEQPLKSWFEIAENANWKTPTDIKTQFRSVSFLNNNRVVFNIAGNKYRLIIRLNYAYQVIYIRFIGTHKEYDFINANEV